MEHDFLGLSSGKFPGATEHLKGSPVFPDGIFQTEIRVPFFKAIFDTSFRPSGRFPLMELIRTMFKRESGAKFTSPEFCVPFA